MTDLSSDLDAHVAQLRGEHRDIAANQAMVVGYLRQWSSRVRHDSAERDISPADHEYLLGYQQALLDVAAQLDDGDMLPGGLVDQVMSSVSHVA